MDFLCHAALFKDLRDLICKSQLLFKKICKLDEEDISKFALDSLCFANCA